MPQISNDRVEFTEFSAKRRHQAKPRHATARYVKVRQAKRHQVKRHQAKRRHLYRHSRPDMVRHGAGFEAYASVPDLHGIVPAHYAAPTVAVRSVAAPSRRGAISDVGGVGIVAEARRYIGTNPTGRSALWCAHFMNMVLERTGRRGTGSGFARSFASYGTRVSGPQVGAIAVMSRGRGGGHVGVVSGIDPNGNPIVISGNHGRRVAETVYPRGRIYAYVMP